MQIGISILLTFAVFKLRLSDDVPSQSDTIPLINIYYFVCMSFSLASMIWFSMVNYLKQRDKPLTKMSRYIIVKYLCRIMCIQLNELMLKSKRNLLVLKKISLIYNFNNITH